MKREIKFRYVIKDNGKLKTFIATLDEIQKGFGGLHDIEIISRDQFTGLKDKNGKEIYEGDILSLTDGNAKVEWSDVSGSFDVVFNDGGNLSLWEGLEYPALGKNIVFEIIGNIYDNPELIKS